MTLACLAVVPFTLPGQQLLAVDTRAEHPIQSAETPTRQQQCVSVGIWERKKKDNERETKADRKMEEEGMRWEWEKGQILKSHEEVITVFPSH